MAATPRPPPALERLFRALQQWTVLLAGLVFVLCLFFVGLAVAVVVLFGPVCSQFYLLVSFTPFIPGLKQGVLQWCSDCSGCVYRMPPECCCGGATFWELVGVSLNVVVGCWLLFHVVLTRPRLLSSAVVCSVLFLPVVVLVVATDVGFPSSHCARCQWPRIHCGVRRTPEEGRQTRDPQMGRVHQDWCGPRARSHPG